MRRRTLPLAVAAALISAGFVEWPWSGAIHQDGIAIEPEEAFHLRLLPLPTLRCGPAQAHFADGSLVSIDAAEFRLLPQARLEIFGPRLAPGAHWPDLGSGSASAGSMHLVVHDAHIPWPGHPELSVNLPLLRLDGKGLAVDFLLQRGKDILSGHLAAQPEGPAWNYRLDNTFLHTEDLELANLNGKGRLAGKKLSGHWQASLRRPLNLALDAEFDGLDGQGGGFATLSAHQAAGEASLRLDAPALAEGKLQGKLALDAHLAENSLSGTLDLRGNLAGSEASLAGKTQVAQAGHVLYQGPLDARLHLGDTGMELSLKAGSRGGGRLFFGPGKPVASLAWDRLALPGSSGPAAKLEELRHLPFTGKISLGELQLGTIIIHDLLIEAD